MRSLKPDRSPEPSEDEPDPPEPYADVELPMMLRK